VLNRRVTLVTGVSAQAADSVFVRARRIAGQLPGHVNVEARRSGKTWNVTVSGARRDVAVFMTYWND